VSQSLVAIVGAPNVGKSTLFNRLIGRRQAIVTDEPGVTRDRLYGRVARAPVAFDLVDTGGLTPRTAALYAREIERQAEAALGEASLVLLVVDARAGATAVDHELAGWLRRRGQPILLVANKVDVPARMPLVLELHELGLGEPLPVSAEHGLGIDELLDAIAERLGPDAGGAPAETPAPAEEIRVAIVGRPNVGKSSLLNRLLGEERVMVSEVAGTTRDSVDTRLVVDERRYLLVDTAGIRRRGKARLAAEVFSVQRARAAVERCDVALLVLDAAAGFAAQDAHIAGYVLEAHKPLVVVVNKWDLISDREPAARGWQEEIERRLRFLKAPPLALVSALTGQRVSRLLERVDRLYEAASQRVPTPELNAWLQDAARPERGAPYLGRRIRFFYATQTGVRPPGFVLFCNDARRVHFSLRRYLDNSLRRRFGFDSVPLRLRFRGRRDR